MTDQSSYNTMKEPSGWAVGWAAFAAMMMLVGGVWWVIAGIVALVNENFFVFTENYVFKFNVVTWGWIHLLIGILVFVAGLGVFRGATWARTVGVIVAAIAGVLAFSWLPWYPLWALIFIGLSVTVIWALTVHGRDLANV